jgi:hypothetical protein
MSEKISQMTSGNPAQGSDQIPINRGGANFSITAASIAALAGGGGGGILGLWPGNWLGINIAGSVNGAALLDGSAFGMSPVQIDSGYPAVILPPTATTPRGAQIQSSQLNQCAGIGDICANVTTGTLRDWFMKGAISGTTASRYWIGCTDMAMSSVPTGFFTNTPAANFIGFRWSAGTDSNYVAVCQTDATHQTVVDTGVAVVANAIHLFEMVPQSGGTTIKFYIDGTLVATINTNVPSNTTPMASMFTVDGQNSGSTTFNFNFYYVYALVVS